MPGVTIQTPSADQAAATTAPAAASFGDNKGIMFHIKAGGAKWACTLQDRAT